MGEECREENREEEEKGRCGELKDKGGCKIEERRGAGSE